MTIARTFLNSSYNNIGDFINNLLEEADIPRVDENKMSFFYTYHFSDGSELVLEQHKYDEKWEKYLI